jgi:hypothetical protein
LSLLEKLNSLFEPLTVQLPGLQLLPEPQHVPLLPQVVLELGEG